MSGGDGGYDVRPQELFAAAGALEGDAGEIAGAVARGTAALGRAVGGSSGLLAAALSTFQGELARQSEGLVDGVRGTGAAVGLASITYLLDDSSAASGAHAVHVPGSTP